MDALFQSSQKRWSHFPSLETCSRGRKGIPICSIQQGRKERVILNRVGEKKKWRWSRREEIVYYSCFEIKIHLIACSWKYYSCFKTVQVPVYSEQDYQMYLHDDGWTKAETDHLFDLCKRFDLRFIVIHDRYDHQQYRVSSLSWFSFVPNIN